MSSRFAQLMAAVEPYLFRGAVAVLVLGALAVGGYRYYQSSVHPTVTLGGSRVVVFDVVKLANAQRKVASALMGKDPSQAGEQAALLLEIQGRTRDVVREVAGPGTLVLVKQAVIHTEMEDITDAVLVKLRLPVDAPTQDLASGGIDYAPTVLGLTPHPTSTSQNRAGADVLSGRGEVLP